MTTGLPIILFVAVAGFHSVVSFSLHCAETTKLPDERAFEENSTTPQTDESQEYEAAHVKDGETKAVTDTTEKKNDEESEDGEREALTDATGANTGSDAPTEHSEQVGENVKSSEDSSDEEYGGIYGI